MFQPRFAGEEAEKPPETGTTPVPPTTETPVATKASSDTPMKMLVEALCKDDQRVFENALRDLRARGKIGNEPSDKPAHSFYHVVDEPTQTDLVVLRRNDGTRLFWFDFHDMNNPYFDSLKERFSFLPIRKQLLGKEETDYEIPSIDKDNIQLTFYSLVPEETAQPEPTGNTENSTKKRRFRRGKPMSKASKTEASLPPQDPVSFKCEPMRIFAGENFLVTVHGAPNSSADKARERFLKAPQGKTPKTLLNMIFDDVVTKGYNRPRELLNQDLNALNQRIQTSTGGDKQVNTEIALEQARIDSQASVMTDTLWRQQEVLEDLLTLIEDSGVDFIDVGKIEDYQAKLQAREDKMDALVTRINTVAQHYVANTNNHSNQLMKKLATGAVMLALPTAHAGFMGMNVDNIPFADQPWGFAAHVALGLIVLPLSALGVFKKIKWF